MQQESNFSSGSKSLVRAAIQLAALQAESKA
jgi:hypothetical protein